MLRKRVLGGHKKQVATIANWFPSHQQGRVKEVIMQMARKPGIPLEAYGGGHRSNVRLTSFERAKEFADCRGVDTRWL